MFLGQENPLEKNRILSHYLIQKLRNQCFLSFSIKSISLPELAHRCSVLFLLQTDFINWQFKAFVQFYDFTSDKRNIVQGSSICCVFLYEEPHFTEL